MHLAIPGYGLLVTMGKWRQEVQTPPPQLGAQRMIHAWICARLLWTSFFLFYTGQDYLSREWFRLQWTKSSHIN